MPSNPARLRYLAAIALALAAGCRERERWPEPDRVRARPPANKPEAGLDCEHGFFCVPPPEAPPRAAVPAPYASCDARPRVPDDTAPNVPWNRRGRLRTRFDEERTLERRDAGGEACCYFWYEHCRGRPVLDGGRPALAPVVERVGWAASLRLDVTGLSARRRAGLAAHWAREAAFEHASIASFERAARALEAVSAPADLVDDHRAAARDELRHARLAYGLASIYAGRALGPGELRVRRVRATTWAAIAASTYAEGCVAETIAAEIVREAARGARDPALASWLGGIARDEARHAELAWRTAAFAVARGGSAARAATARAAARVRAAADSVSQQRPSGAGMAAFGVVGAERSRAISAGVLDQVIAPCTQALLLA